MSASREQNAALLVLFEAGKQIAERALLASQERVNLPGLRCAGSVCGVQRHPVAFHRTTCPK